MGDTLATWQEVRNYIAANYEIQTDNGDSLILVRPGVEGRTQLVSVMLSQVGLSDGDDMIKWLSPFAVSSAVSADQALAAAAGAPFGVTKNDDYYWLVHTQLAATVDPAEIDVPMRYVAVFADFAESKLSLSDGL